MRKNSRYSLFGGVAGEYTHLNETLRPCFGKNKRVVEREIVLLRAYWTNWKIKLYPSFTGNGFRLSSINYSSLSIFKRNLLIVNYLYRYFMLSIES